MRSKKSKYVIYIFIIFLIIILAGIFYKYKMMNPGVVEVEKIEITETEVSIKYGENYKIEYNIEPANATDKGVIWESSNSRLVDVDEEGNLIVNSNASGEVTITAISKVGEAKTSFKVKVEKIDKVVKVTGIKLDQTILNLKYGTSSKLTATITPSNATNKNIEWISSDPNLVTVDNKGNLKVVGNTNGEVTITAKTKDGKCSASAKIIIEKVETEVKVKGVKIDKPSVNLKYGATIKLNPIISPSDATNKNVEWTTSDPSLVTVDSIGNVKAVGNKDGEATITVKTVDGYHKASIKVKVTKVEIKVKVTGVKLDKNSVTLEYGKTSKLVATITPSNATNKNVEWISSDPSLVTVDKNGTIKAVANKDGSATISVKTKDGGYMATTKVIVSKIKVTGIKLDKTTASLKYGESTKIIATIKPTNAANKNVTWTSSDPSLVTVDSSGNIKAVGNKNGSATITVKTVDGGYIANIKVTVSGINVTGLSLDKSIITLKYGNTVKVNATIKPNNAANKNVTWTSSNTSLVTVDSSGNIKAVANKDGTATVTVKTADGGYSASVKVTVTSIKVTGVKLNKSSATLLYGKTAKLTATVSPSNAANKSVTWTSSNTSLVTVDSSGNLKAKSGKIGQATITVKTNDGGYTAKTNVTIFPSGNAISFTEKYDKYKTNMLLHRQNSYMQNFLIDNSYIYITQTQTSANAGPAVSKIKLGDVQNSTGTGQQFFNNTAILENFGHGDVFDIEKTNDKTYLWTLCSVQETWPKSFCRIDFNKIKYGTSPLKNKYTDLTKGTLKIDYPKSDNNLDKAIALAVDSDNRIVTMLFGTTTSHIFKIYNLDDYIKNGKNAKLLSTFTINNSKVDKNKSYSISRQGIDVSGNYIYSYEGNKSDKDGDRVITVSVYDLSGNIIVYRKKINYPDTKYIWEPEGIKVYNGTIYIGMGRDDAKDHKTANIYVLRKSS